MRVLTSLYGTIFKVWIFKRPQWVHPTSYTALPGLCFRPWISLPADLWCP